MSRVNRDETERLSVLFGKRLQAQPYKLAWSDIGVDMLVALFYTFAAEHGCNLVEAQRVFNPREHRPQLLAVARDDGRALGLHVNAERVAYVVVDDLPSFDNSGVAFDIEGAGLQIDASGTWVLVERRVTHE